MNESSNIEWDKFSGEYFVLADNEPTDVVLSNWTQIEKVFGEDTKTGIGFTVLEVEGKPAEKSYQVFSKKLIATLKPIIQDAERKGQKSFKIRITKAGLGLSTTYSVKRLGGDEA